MGFVSGAKSLFMYEEPRVVKFQSIGLCLIYWLGIILVFGGLIIGYLIVFKQGWAKNELAESAVTTKLYGLTVTNNRIWDNAEYMVPPKENGAFTVITSILETHQHEGICEESPYIPAGHCRNNSDCHANHTVFQGNGVMTGKCVPSTMQTGTRVCEIRAWCPVELKNSSKKQTIATGNFTAFIRNSIQFPSIGPKSSIQNFWANITNEDLRTCTYDENDPINKHCPVFKVATIVEKTGNTWENMAQLGGVIEMIIEWDCLFSLTDSADEECLPTYHFQRLDHQANSGFHLRYAEHYQGNDSTLHRTLFRAYGIRVIVTVHGKGRKFDFGQFFISVGSGLGFLSLVNFMMSKVILKVLHSLCGCFRCLGYREVEKVTTDIVCCDHSCKSTCSTVYALCVGDGEEREPIISAPESQVLHTTPRSSYNAAVSDGSVNRGAEEMV